MKRIKRYIGSYEISFNHTTWRDWLPMIIASVSITVAILIILVCAIIKGV